MSSLWVKFQPSSTPPSDRFWWGVLVLVLLVLRLVLFVTGVKQSQLWGLILSLDFDKKNGLCFELPTCDACCYTQNYYTAQYVTCHDYSQAHVLPAWLPGSDWALENWEMRQYTRWRQQHSSQEQKAEKIMVRDRELFWASSSQTGS